jgi:hypothetical protein
MSDWRESLSEEMRSKPIVANARDLNHLVEQTIGLESKMGRSLTIPQADSTPEEWALFNEKALKNSDKLVMMDNKDDLLTKMGKPADREGYKADPDKEYTIDVEAAKDQALALGLTQDQYFAMVNNAQDRVNAQGETNKAALDASRNALYEEWGAAKPGKLESIEGMMELFKFPEEARESMRNNMPADVLAAMARVAEGVSGEKITAANDRTQGKAIVTPAEAEGLINKYREHEAFTDKTHPQHKHNMNNYLAAIDMAAGRPPKPKYL